MTLPTIHPNGTPARVLAASAEAAYAALEVAYELLKQTGPNNRDFYLQADGAFEKARAEHAERVQKIADVQIELTELIGHCDRQGGGW